MMNSGRSVAGNFVGAFFEDDSDGSLCNIVFVSNVGERVVHCIKGWRRMGNLYYRPG